MQDKPWRVWFQENTDRWVLLALFGMLLYIVLHSMTIKADEAAIDWARSSTDLVLGGILGLITGKYQAERKQVDQITHQPPLPVQIPTLDPTPAAPPTLPPAPPQTVS